MKHPKLIVDLDGDTYQVQLINRVVGDRVPEFLHEYFIQQVFKHLMEEDEKSDHEWTVATIRKLINKAVKDCEKKGRH
jgi:hypothetical protein